MKLVLLGDGESPHLVKWARALEPRLELYAISSRGFALKTPRVPYGRPTGRRSPSPAIPTYSS